MLYDLFDDLIIEFQFQIGTIGSRHLCSNKCGITQFQFQIGTIGRFRKLRWHDRWYSFQFQIGTIGSIAAGVALLALGGFNSRLVRLAASVIIIRGWIWSVSIPDWCDWQLPDSRIQCGVWMFQFQIGAIGSGRAWPVSHWIFSFQFQIGAIGSNQQAIERFEKNKVSIPDWCDWQGWDGFPAGGFKSFNSRLVRLAALAFRIWSSNR